MKRKEEERKWKQEGQKYKTGRKSSPKKVARGNNLDKKEILRIGIEEER
jgi:hypothetical protein